MKYSSAIYFFLFIIMLTPAQAKASDHLSDHLSEIVRANGLYSDKHYAESARAYETLVQKGVENGYLYYNLGNAYIRMGKIGPAILNYLHARKWIPRNENLTANLKFAIQQTKDKIEPPGTLSTPLFWINDLNFNELVGFAIGLNIVFWVNLTLWMYFRTPALKTLRNAFLCFLLLSFVSIGVKIENESNLKLGVVLAENVEVKSGRTADAVTLFQLHEGALVTVTDKHDNWLEVRLNGEQKGWVPQNSLGT